MTERSFIIQDEILFRSITVTPIYPLITPLTLGLVKVYRMHMDEDKIYVVDAGFNDVFVYDRASAGHREKYFWKLNLKDNPALKVECIPRQFDIAVEVPDIPSFDPKFGERGGWVTMKYHVRVRLEVPREQIGQLRRTVNPLTTVRNAVRRAARRIFPLMPYREALIATAEERVGEHITGDPGVRATGLRIVLVDVEGIEGSRKLAEELQQSFGRLLQAGDRRDIAVQFASLDREVFQRMLEDRAPEAALEFRGRAANQMLEALLASGKSLPEIAAMSGWASRNIGQREPSLATDVTIEALKGIEKWPPPSMIPQDVSHAERLKWEHQVVEDRVPTQLQSSGDSDTFAFAFETGDELKVIWWAPQSPPEVLINGRDRRSDYVCLSPGIYDYSKTTVWDIYWETRRLLGVAGGASSDQ